MTEPQHMTEDDWKNAREQLRRDKLAERRRLFREALEKSKADRAALHRKDAEK